MVLKTMHMALRCVVLRRQAIVLETADAGHVHPISIYIGAEYFQVFVDGFIEDALMGRESIGFGIQKT
tara:strand:+ start:526 stop:729 length:204 start_codon:yes stop_codon:yes gene_type:complete